MRAGELNHCMLISSAAPFYKLEGFNPFCHCSAVLALFVQLIRISEASTGLRHFCLYRSFVALAKVEFAFSHVEPSGATLLCLKISYVLNSKDVENSIAVLRESQASDTGLLWGVTQHNGQTGSSSSLTGVGPLTRQAFCISSSETLCWPAQGHCPLQAHPAFLFLSWSAFSCLISSRMS